MDYSFSKKGSRPCSGKPNTNDSSLFDAYTTIEELDMDMDDALYELEQEFEMDPRLNPYFFKAMGSEQLMKRARRKM